MKAFLVSVLIIFGFSALAQTEKVENVSLVNALDGKTVNLNDFANKKGVLVIFTSNYCPFSRQYIDRIKAIHTNYQEKGIQLLLINSNSESDNPVESVEEMVNKANENGFSFPYLADKNRVALEMFKATRTPEVFLLKPVGSSFEVVYQGAIDDNPQLADQVRNPFLNNAIEDVLAGRAVQRKYVRPTGCIIRN